VSPIDEKTGAVTAPRKEPTRITLVGGPFGMRPYVLPHEPSLGFKIVMFTDAQGSRMLRPIVYEVRGQRGDEWWAGHAGFATEEDVQRWREGPKK
jgi:hypothetical protein